jgi:hypothetical protein
MFTAQLSHLLALPACVLTVAGMLSAESKFVRRYGTQPRHACTLLCRMINLPFRMKVLLNRTCYLYKSTVARSRTYSWPSPMKKVRPLKKKSGCNHLQLELYGIASHKVVAILSKQIVQPR